MDSIDTEEKAYWLGFFYADAYNKEKTGQIIIELQEKDKKHLYKCAKFFGNPREPYKQMKNKGKYVSYRLELNGRALSNTLKKLGCHQKKSFDITFPYWLKKDLQRHFIRGYFDGDGCLYVNKTENQLGMHIVSTQEMVTIIHNIFKQELNINSYISHPQKYTNNTYRLDSGGSRQVLRFCEWIYKDATIFLDRKHKIYITYKKNHKPRFTENTQEELS